jgi:transcriptional regulator with XRE-family HTH domain
VEADKAKLAEFGKRLRRIRETFGAEQLVMSARMGYRSIQAYSNIERGRNYPKEGRLRALFKAFPQISREFLLEGKGEMFLDMREAITDDAAPNKRLGLRSPPIDGEILSAKTLKNELLRSTDTPTLGDLRYWRTKSNAMTPTIQPGDLLVVQFMRDYNNQIKEGLIYLVKVEGNYMIRRIQTDPINKVVHLHCVNETYRSLTVEDRSKMEIIGRIVRIIRDLP